MVPRADDATDADVQLADRVRVCFGGCRGGCRLFLGSFLLGGLFGGFLHLREARNGHVDIDGVVVEVDVRHGEIGAGSSRSELHVRIPANHVHEAVVTLESALGVKRDKKTNEGGRGEVEAGIIRNRQSSGKSDKGLVLQNMAQADKEDTVSQCSVHDFLDDVKSIRDLGHRKHRKQTSFLSAAPPPSRTAVFLSLETIASITAFNPVTVVFPSSKEYSF